MLNEKLSFTMKCLAERKFTGAFYVFPQMQVERENDWKQNSVITFSQNISVETKHLYDKVGVVIWNAEFVKQCGLQFCCFQRFQSCSAHVYI